jgi:Na+/melibiose symporter-like transporter
MIQMFIMAIGIVIALATFSTLSKSNAKELGLILAIVIFLFFAFITFFRISEMHLLEFMAKKVKDLFLDTTKKFQINFRKTPPTDILIAKSRSKEGKQKIEIKS